jgi:hypothetical protein
MTHKAITLKFVVPTVLAVALGITIGAAYLTDKRFGAADQSEAIQSVAGNRGVAESPNPDARLSRVRLLLFDMK